VSARRSSHSSRVPAPVDPRAERRAVLVREGLILVGFLALVAIAIGTVVVPELRRDPESTEATQGAAANGSPGASGTAAAPAP
jgi:hypothetical protein